MPINFPPGAVDGDKYPSNANLQQGELQYEYDEPNNSWNIIAPNNIATTDYVDSLIGDQGRNIRRNYDLHNTTNEILYRNTLVEEEVVACSNTYKSSILAEYNYVGDVPVDPPNDIVEIITSGYTVPQWGECIDSAPRQGDSFSFLGVNLDSGNLSRDLTHIHAFSLYDNTVDESNFVPNSILEFTIKGQDKDGFSDSAYALYRILSVYKYSASIAIGVEHLESYSLNGQPVYAATAHDHSFRVYSAALASTGGKVSGKLKVVGDAIDIFSVWRNDTNNPYEIFNIDSTNNTLAINEEYSNSLLINAAVADPLLLANVGYVNNRLGLTNLYDVKDNGPFLQIRGGTLTGALTIRATVSEGSAMLEIHGRPMRTGSAAEIATRPMLSVLVNSGGDYLHYEGLCTRPKEVMTYERTQADIVSKLDTNIQPKLDKKVNKAGDQLTGKLYYSTRYDIPQMADDDLVPFILIKDLTVTKVIDNPPDVNAVDRGYLYEIGGQLYYKSYN
jgi:hypothetical protein